MTLAAGGGDRAAQPPLGGVLAGGQSVRYGAPKALAEVGGIRIIERVLAALYQVTPDLVVSANEPELFADLELPTYPDERPDAGALGGIHTLLLRAREADRPGIVALACDMPFPSVPLLRLVAGSAFGSTRGPVDDEWAEGPSVPEAARPDVVVPESRGRRGIEPLFAAYRTSAIPAIEAALDSGDRRMIGFHDAVRVHRIPLTEVERIADPARTFLNVNTTDERVRAESMIERETGQG